MLPLNKRKSLLTSTSKYSKIMIEDVFCRHICIWYEYLSKLRIRKLQWVSDPDTRLRRSEQKHRTIPGHIVWHMRYFRHKHQKRTTRKQTWAAPTAASMKTRDVTDTGLWLSPIPYQRPPPLRASTDHTFSSVTRTEVSQCSWIHGPSLSHASILVSHKHRRKLGTGCNSFTSQ